MTELDAADLMFELYKTMADPSIRLWSQTRQCRKTREDGKDESTGLHHRRRAIGAAAVATAASAGHRHHRVGEIQPGARAGPHPRRRAGARLCEANARSAMRRADGPRGRGPSRFQYRA